MLGHLEASSNFEELEARPRTDGSWTGTPRRARSRPDRFDGPPSDEAAARRRAVDPARPSMRIAAAVMVPSRSMSEEDGHPAFFQDGAGHRTEEEFVPAASAMAFDTSQADERTGPPPEAMSGTATSSGCARLRPAFGPQWDRQPLGPRSSRRLLEAALRVCPGRGECRIRMVGATDRMPEPYTGWFHPSYNRRTGLPGPTLSCRRRCSPESVTRPRRPRWSGRAS